MFKILLNYIFLIVLVCIPINAKAQTIRISLDTKALNSILKNSWGSYYNLPGPFAARDIQITSISIFGLRGSFILDFKGKLEIKVPFWGVQTIKLAQSLYLEYSCSLKTKNTYIYIPVKSITISKGKVAMPMNSKAMILINQFQKMITSDKSTKTFLEKQLRINLAKTLTTYLGQGKWKIRKKLEHNKLVLSVSKTK